MAEFQYTPVCACGRPLKVFKSSGRVQKMCSECRIKNNKTLYKYPDRKSKTAACQDCGRPITPGCVRCRYCANRKTGIERAKPKVCKRCSTVFDPVGERKSRYASICGKCKDSIQTKFYCADCGGRTNRYSLRCRACAQKAKAQVSLFKRSRICVWCQTQFVKKKGAQSAEGNKYCSRDCAFKHKAELSAPRKAAIVARSAAYQARQATKDGAHSKIWFRSCSDCGRRYVACKWQQSRCVDCAAIHRSSISEIGERQCRACGATFLGHRHRKFCSSDCSYHSHKRTYRAKRRARESASIEPVNPYVVFTNYGWKCAMCGKQTPRARRGTNYSNAPELDHIIPLALGGSHTYSNVQCACRACNGKKGATRVHSQASLFMGVTMTASGG